MKSVKSICEMFAGVLILGVLSFGVFYRVKEVHAAPFIPEADVTYDQNNGWDRTLSDTLILEADIAVKLSGITLTDANGPVISIRNNARVDLIIEGDNILSVASVKASPNACIEVLEGSTLNIYGIGGSSLTVTGGYYSAGIGTKGAGSHGTVHSPNTPGTINIFSGTITARGGSEGGSGIGSGRGSNGGEINIYDGTVTAYGNGGGAGIGSGYCTSGGKSNTNYQSGSFNGGIINITGGIVRAAAGLSVDFNTINPEDPSTYSSENSFGAGIGGGYGSTSGTITIGGSANVFAVGTGGGAGIGAGRGTSDLSKYVGDCTPFDITISGKANVQAYAGADTRKTGSEAMSGAAIGGGRGFGRKDVEEGVIEIKDDAQVSANAGAVAQAIGSSVAVGDTLTASTVFTENDFPKPKKAVIETQCVSNITASVGGREVDNALVSFTIVIPEPPVVVEPSAEEPSVKDEHPSENNTPVPPTPDTVKVDVKAEPTWTAKSGDYTITIQESGNITFDKMTGLFIDNKELKENEDYTKSRGSIILTIKSAVLKKLIKGDHAFVAKFGDETVNVPLKIKTASNNNYNDDDDDSVTSRQETSSRGKKDAPKTGQ